MSSVILFKASAHLSPLSLLLSDLLTQDQAWVVAAWEVTVRTVQRWVLQRGSGIRHSGWPGCPRWPWPVRVAVCDAKRDMCINGPKFTGVRFLLTVDGVSQPSA